MKAFAHVEPPGRSDRQDRRHHAATQQKHPHQPCQAAHAGLSWSGKGAHQKIVYAFLVLLQFLSRVIPSLYKNRCSMILKAFLGREKSSRQMDPLSFYI